MRISDWSSDVCSSDLFEVRRALGHLVAGLPPKFLIELVTRAALHPAQVAGREELLKLVEHHKVGRRLGVPKVGGRSVRAREPHKLGPHVRILPTGGLVDVAQRQRRHVLGQARSEEPTSELQSLMRISYAVFC